MMNIASQLHLAVGIEKYSLIKFNIFFHVVIVKLAYRMLIIIYINIIYAATPNLYIPTSNVRRFLQ